MGEKIYHSNLKEGIIIALSLQVVNEGVRRMSRSQTKRSLKRFEKELRRYDLIKRTLRESKIEIIRPSRAQEVCQKMQRTKEILGPYGSINLDRVNEDLTSAYRKAGAIIE